MDHRSLALCLSSATLAMTTGVYGFKFVRKRNFLLGFEWWIVTISASNALLFFVTESPVSYGISHFLDAFSRGFGMPVIAVAGLMAVTHGYRPSVRQDLLLFVLAAVGTVALVAAGFLQGVLPYFYVTMWTLLSVYLAGFVMRLLRAGHAFHALTTTVALVASQSIACIYDFYRIPGEDTNVVFNFYVLALLTWSYFTVVIYYAYSALERGKGRSQAGAGVLSYPK
ncbi:hypothetical protein P350_23580 [Burkholderia cepacia JBK9]|uniref:Membrane protein n=1 Tax=Burkholderia arboris TaxID=488730 RepID=A0A9Q9SNQ0_9BURK|nr:hypothetical protein [Burkholderia arboris]ALX14523.1 hypothetical protein P350_23580 [Burkholderia cepacia JBK9]MCA8490237.1 hypothetical protein [Burkholderia arboris]UTV58845.1 hypothetical protein NLX30_22165 [Burkholderia arboris]VWC20503.1 membrane protein [Burkholderia arboris]